MSQIVIEFGAREIDPVLNGMLSVVGQPSAIEVERRDGGAATGIVTADALDSIRNLFSRGEIKSATFRTGSALVRYGLILEPQYGATNLSMWLGTIELTTEQWHPYWETLLQSKGLAFACVGNEEGVELADEDLTISTFPWDAWPILIGALKAGDGHDEWVIKEPSGTQALM